MDKDFSGTPLAIGSMVGVRRFMVPSTAAGYLIGVRGGEWRDGINVADCLFREEGEELDHPVADKECTCGFWAYSDPEYVGSRDPFSTMTVTSVVEGFGHVTYGPRGFRCSKARLLGLVAPDPSSGRQRRAWIEAQLDDHEQQDWLVRLYFRLLFSLPSKSVFWWYSMTPEMVCLLLPILVTTLVWFPLVISVKALIPFSSMLYVLTFLLFGKLSRRINRGRREFEDEVYFTAVTMQVLRTRYPDVDLYPSVSTMCAAHPPTVLELEGDQQ